MAYVKLLNLDFNSAIRFRPGPKAAQFCRTCFRAWPQINLGAQDPLSGLHPKPRALDQSRASKRCSQGRIYHLIRSSKSLRAECLHGSNQDCWIRNPGDQLEEDPFAIRMREIFEKAGIPGNPLTEDDISSDLLAVIEELSVKRGKEIQVPANKYVRYSILGKVIFRDVRSTRGSIIANEFIDPLIALSRTRILTVIAGRELPVACTIINVITPIRHLHIWRFHFAQFNQCL